MTEPVRGRWRSRDLILVALVGGLGTLAIAFLSEWLFPDWPRARRGAMLGAWLVLTMSLAGAYARRRESPR